MNQIMQVMILQESEPGFRVNLYFYPPDSIVELNTVVVSNVITLDKEKDHITISSFLVSRFGIGCKKCPVLLLLRDFKCPIVLLSKN